MAELQDIIDAIVAIQEAMTPPTDEKRVTAYDEPPATPIVYPSFINVERDSEQSDYAERPIITAYIIDMHLIFATVEKKYSYRSKRKWIKPVREAIATNGKLNGTVNWARLQGMDFHPEGLTYGGVEYDAITFTLQATVQDQMARIA